MPPTTPCRPTSWRPDTESNKPVLATRLLRRMIVQIFSKNKSGTFGRFGENDAVFVATFRELQLVAGRILERVRMATHESTVLRWHREGVRLFWRLKCRIRSQGGSRISEQVIAPSSRWQLKTERGEPSA